ncbi:hypothetical protein [Romboutsia sp.]|uniref:hypothetical protein n=1 Tax=Romboutsia sp. TaxID=1965302 RepID=UPI003F328728
MNFKDYDEVKVPDNVYEYIDKGIKKGIKHQHSKKSTIPKAASIVLISGITLIGGSNIPVFANELIKIPIVGEIVKVLDFTTNKQGGLITDGNSVIIDSLDKDTINIYFSDNNKIVANAPNYKIEKREYPYTLVITFNGVRRVEKIHLEDKVKKLPYVKDVYDIMILDDSSYKMAIEFNKNVDLKLTEHKDPGMLQIKVKESNKTVPNKLGYFVRTSEYEFGEEIAQIEEMLYGQEKLAMQKTENGKYIIQLGPYDREDIAKSKMKEISKIIGNTETFSVEKRNLGQGPKF